MKYFIAIVVLLIGGFGALFWLNHSRRAPSSGNLVVYCAAGVRKPVNAVAGTYEKEFGVTANLQYGGSGALLSTIRASQTGDLFIAADMGTIDKGRKLGLIREVIPIAMQRPVIAVRKGNPKSIKTLDDLLRPDVKFALCNPESASIGKVTREALGGRWEEFRSRAAVLKPTVTDLATDVTLGTVDAAVVWDSTLPQFTALSAVQLPEMAKFEETVSVGVLTSCKQPAAALRFARYLAAPTKGGAEIAQSGLRPVPGDAWSPRPKFVFYSGSVNRLALEKSLHEFADREGVDVTTVFNGCGILCASMRAMANTPGAAIPDAYYACDICFVPPVADLYPQSVILTETDIVLAVAKGNPKKILTLDDLTRPGLKVGICNAQQATLGYMTKGILSETGKYNAILKNVCSQVPTADLLINQLRTGSLDAAIVYLVNAKPVHDFIDVLPITYPGAMARQPFAVAAHSPNSQLAHRLLDFLRADPARFVAAGFRWRGDQPSFPSRNIQVPSWMTQANE